MSSASKSSKNTIKAMDNEKLKALDKANSRSTANLKACNESEKWFGATWQWGKVS